MKEINIPVEHFEKFKFYVELPAEVKQDLIGFLSDVPLGTSPSSVINSGAKAVSQLSRERLSDIIIIYHNLSRAKDNFGLEIDDFMPVLAHGLENTGVEELMPSESVLNDFRNLLSSSNSIAATFKIMDTMTDNQKTFLDLNISQNIRAAFDNSDTYLGSVIVHNLKIIYRENEESKEVYISLDNDDIEAFISSLKKCQERTNKLMDTFNSKSIIEIK